MSKCTVLGASGFIGSGLARHLARLGHDVWTPARQDRLDQDPLGHVFYCIGLTADFRTRPFDTVRAHVSLLAEILERADFDSLLYLSSTRVYSGSSSTDEYSPLVISPSLPADLYNASKLMGEAICLQSGRKGTKVARLSNVIGFDPRSFNFASELIRESLSGNICLRTSPKSSKDYILLDDVLKLLPLISLEGQNQIYNVASGLNITHAEFCRRLVDITGCLLEVSENSPEVKFGTIETSRIAEEFNFSPGKVLDDLPSLVARYREYLQ